VRGREGGAARFPVIDPATEDALTELADATGEDALEAARSRIVVQQAAQLSGFSHGSTCGGTPPRPLRSRPWSPTRRA